MAAFAEIALHREHSNQSFVKEDTDDKQIKDVDTSDNLLIDESPKTVVENNVTHKEIFKSKESLHVNRKSNIVLTFGNNLGFRIKKKRVNNKKNTKKVMNKKSKKVKQINKNIVKDIYDFDDSLENTDFEIEKLKGYVSSKTPLKTETKLTNDEKPVDEENSLQQSDDDDFDYLSDNMTDISSVDSAETVKTKLDVEGNPKRLIVGKIFRKNLKDKPEKPNLDELFDTLLSENVSDAKIENVKTDPVMENAEKQVTNKNNNRKKNHRSKTIIEQELGMSFQQIKEIIGFATRKSQRKCTTGKQNVLAENWSSDEDLDTRLTKEKSKAAKENIENKSTRIRKSNAVLQAKNLDLISKPFEEKPINGCTNNKEESIVNGELVNGTSNRPKNNKRTNRKRHKDDQSGSESECDAMKKRARKVRKKRKSIKEHDEPNIAPSSEVLPDIVEKIASDISVEKIAVGSKKRNKQNLTDLDAQTAAILSLPRRKRVSTDMLYYWSSSSDEDQYAGMIEVKPIRDDVNLTEHPIQHGWIVGDSHKKLVTLLAHAKGKKTEDCAVKESHIKKNRSTL